jgi:hypothetical protein
MRSRIAAAFSGVTKDLLPKAAGASGAPRNKREAAARREGAPAPEKGGAGGAAPGYNIDAQDFERALAAVESRIDQMSDEEVTAFAKRIGILR